MYFKNFKLILFILFSISFGSAHAAIDSKKINVAGHALYYNEAGKGQNIVLVHGLFANKEQWLSMQMLLAHHGYHVVALDLPGYGKSLGFPFADYQLPQQVKLLHQFVHQLALKHFNLAGNSMGGAIVALYALKYPHEVTSVAFIGSPLGVKTPRLSPTNKLFNQGIDPFLPRTQKELTRLLNLLFVHPPTLTKQAIQQILQDNQKNYDYKNNIVNVALSPYRHFMNRSLSFKQPVLIIWGKQDKIFDISGAKVLQRNIADSYLDEMNQAGHLLQVENPKQATTNYLIFLRNIKK